MNRAGFAAAGVLREEKADLDGHMAGRCNHGAAWSTCITPPCTELSSHGHLPLEARGSAIKPCVRGSLLSCPATRQHSHTALQINQLPVICNKPQLSCGAILLHAQHQSLLLHASWLLPLAHYLLVQRSHHLITCRVTYCPSLFPISTSLSWSCSTSCIPTRPRSFPSPILYIRAQTTESKLVSSATHSSTQP